MAYFRLLVNTRDEVALATALTSMEKTFSHEAFTALKKMAKSLELPMYQVEVNFMICDQLFSTSESHTYQFITFQCAVMLNVFVSFISFITVGENFFLFFSCRQRYP